MDINLPSWASVEKKPAPAWQLVQAYYVSPEDPINNGSTNIYVQVLDENGVYLPGIRVYQQWPTDRAFEYTKPLGQGPNFNQRFYGCSFYMSGDSSFDPARGQVGPYSIYIETPERPSEVVHGLGLPLNRHVQYLLTFQRVLVSVPVPSTGQWAVMEQTDTRIVLERQSEP